LGKTQNAALAHDPARSEAEERTDNRNRGAVRGNLDPYIASDNADNVPRTAATAPGTRDNRAQAQTENAQKRAPVAAAADNADAATASREHTTLAARPHSPLSAASTDAKPASSELAFLKSIQVALHAGEPRKVLELCQEHERRWPQGTFVEEREGLRSIAACQAHAANAVSNANKFSAAYPRSPMLSRVLAACTPPSAAKR
jgi:hypothetical protein